MGPVLKQVLFAFIANMGNISPGMTFGFSAIAIPQMKNPNATFTIDDDQASWMASLATLSTAMGCLVSGSVMDHFGRRAALLGLNVPGFLGWLLIAFAHGDATLGMVYAGRIITGLAAGMSSSPPAVYTAEISSDKMRGILVTWTSIAVSLGILIVYVLGTIIKDDWRAVAGICAGLPALSFALDFFILPESPSWLASKGKHTQAAAILEKIHGKPEIPIVPTRQSEQIKPDKFTTTLLSAITIKPFLILTLFFFFQQFSGVFVIIFYAVDIVQEAGIRFDPYLTTILIGITRLFVSILLSLGSNKFGRRPPSIVSGAGMTLCMGALATYTFLQATKAMLPATAEQLSWIPITSLVLYILTSTIGFLTLPWAMVGELFPTRVRGLLAGLTTCLAYLFSFVIIKIYPMMVHSMQRYGIFFFYGGISLLGTVFVVLFLPETKGKDLKQIEDHFRRKRKRALELEEEQPLEQLNHLPVIVPAKT